MSAARPVPHPASGQDVPLGFARRLASLSTELCSKGAAPLLRHGTDAYIVYSLKPPQSARYFAHLAGDPRGCAHHPFRSTADGEAGSRTERAVAAPAEQRSRRTPSTTIQGGSHGQERIRPRPSRPRRFTNAAGAEDQRPPLPAVHASDPLPCLAAFRQAPMTATCRDAGMRRGPACCVLHHSPLFPVPLPRERALDLLAHGIAEQRPHQGTNEVGHLA